MTGKELGAALPAKLTVPKVDGAVPRPRLFQLLDQAREKPVIWISAPAGSGKTTLVASYLAERKIKPLWYQVDTRDADPAAFFAYLRQAVAKLSRRKRETLPLLTPEYGLGIPTFTLNFFEHIFSRLRKPAILVFDNFQDLAETSPLHELLPEVAKVIPQNTNIIFVSRTDIPEYLAPLRAKQQIARIDAEAMQLRSVEAHHIGKRLLQESVTNEKIETLNNQAGGWLAGLILLLEGAEEIVAGKEINTTVFDYFAAEIMRRADLETQLFLAKCSLLPVMDAETAAGLTGNARAELILKNLVRRNYFINRLPGEVMRYEFHPLFRGYLQDELRRRLNDEELRQLKRLAGLMLTEQEEYADAVGLLSEAGATDELVGLVLGRAETMIAEGRYQTLSRWLEAIPETTYQRQPWLTYWLGVSQMPSNPQSASKCFEQTYEAFESSHDVAGMYLSWAGIAESCTLQWDDFSHMNGWLDKFYALNEAYPDYPSPQIEAQVQYALYSLLVYMQPKHLNFQGAVERLLNSEFGADFRIKNGANLALYYLWSGRLQDMRRVVQTLNELAEQENISPLSQILVKTSCGNLHWVTGEPELACELILEAMNIARKSGVHILDAYCIAHLVYAKGVMQDLDGMREALVLMKKSLIEQRRIDIAHYLVLMSWYKSLRHEYKLSLELAREGMQTIEDLSVQMALSLANFALAKALIENEDYAATEKALDVGLEFSITTPSRHMEWIGRMLQAYMFVRQGKEDEAVKALAVALGVASSESGYWTFPLWDAEMVSELCALALQHDIEKGYVCALIRKWDLPPPRNTAIPVSWPWHVRIHTLGRFALLNDDDSVKLSGKTLEMLKAIIALGGRDVPGYKISDHLWPDAEGEKAQHSFKVTLHRLRKLIGQQVLQMSDGQLTLNQNLVWVDIWNYEHTLSAVEIAADDELSGLVKEALEQYNSGFLPDENASWVLHAQERLRNRFLRIVGQAAERLSESGQWQSAIDCYRRALEIEPLAERFYTGLMRCHYETGQKAEGLAVYQRCHDTLVKELEISPSAETEKWRERLRQ